MISVGLRALRVPCHRLTFAPYGAWSACVGAGSDAARGTLLSRAQMISAGLGAWRVPCHCQNLPLAGRGPRAWALARMRPGVSRAIAGCACWGATYRWEAEGRRSVLAGAAGHAAHFFLDVELFGE